MNQIIRGAFNARRRHQGVVVSVMLALIQVLFGNAAKLQAQDCGMNMLLLTAQGQYVGRPSAAPIELTGPLTMECWAKATGPLTNSTFLEKGDGGSISYSFGIDASAKFSVRLRTSAGERIYQGQNISNPLSWHHYAAVVVPGDSIYLYLDGSRWDVFALAESALASQSDSLRIGLSVVQSRISFIGAIDEIRLWSRARTQSEIQSSMMTTLQSSSPSIAAYYSFDDATGILTIHDFSSQPRNAHLYAPGNCIVPSSSPVNGTLGGFKIAAREQLVDLGVLRCRTSFDTVVHLYNRSETDIIVGSLGFANGVAFSVSSPGNITLTKDSTSTQAARIHFAATAGGVYNDTLIVASSSTCGGFIRIAVRADLRTVALSIDSSVIQFGSIPNCELPATRSVRLHNAGNDIVHITAMDWSPVTDVTLLSPHLPVTLGAGQDTTLVFQLPTGAEGPISTSASFIATECGERFDITLNATRNNIHLAVPPSVTLPTHDANLTNVILDTVISLQNTGLIPFYLSTSTVQGTGYTVLRSQAKSYLLPGDTTSVTIRFQTATCGDFYGTLEIHTNQPCAFDTVIPLQIHIGPPTLKVETPHYELGSTCTTIDTVLRLTNPSDVPVLVRNLVFSLGNAFSVSKRLFPDTLAAHATLTVPITFSPVHAGLYDAEARVIMVPCGELDFTVSASAGLKGVNVSDTLVGFGRGCDITPVSRFIEISNDNATDIVVGTTDIVGAQKFSIISPTTPFTVAAGTKRTVEILYHATTPGRDDALLTVRSQDNCLINRIHLTGSRETPRLLWSNIRVEFDTTCEGDTAFAQVVIHNIGADTVDITNSRVTGSTQFFVDDNVMKIPAGDSGAIRVRYIPQGFGDQSGTLSVTTGPCLTIHTMPVHGSSGPAPQLLVSDTVLNFGRVRAGDSVERCVMLMNQSCSSISIDPSLLKLPTEFTIQSDTTLLILQRGMVRVLCLRYHPTRWDTVNLALPIVSSGGTTNVTLNAIALAPELQLQDSVLDFGYVIIGHQSQLPIRILNLGNVPDQIAISSPHFPSLILSNQTFVLAPGSASVIAFFRPVTIGRILDTIILTNTTGTRRIIVRAEGVDSGLVSSKLEADLGDVRVGDSASQLVALTATNGFDITISPPVAKSPFRIELLTTSINPITSDKDTVWLRVVFTASSEGEFHDTVDLPNSSHPLRLTVGGRGVEAHAVAIPDTIDFGKVQLSGIGTAALTITDTGRYPFTVTSITAANPAFGALPFTPSSQQPPTPRTFTLTFQPIGIKPLQSVVTVHSTALESALNVVVRGRGTYGLASSPDIAYRLPAETNARVGDHVIIPVMLTVSGQSAITLDSLIFEIQFDPFAVYFAGISSSSTLSDGLISTLTHKSDSTIEVSIHGKRTYQDGVLILLNAEALLGPHDSSRIEVTSSIPENVLLPQDAGGLFVVKDCDGNPANVIVSQAATKAVSPNPASNSAQIAYSLPAPMHVRLLVFDVLGKLVRTAVDRIDEKGDQTAVIDCTGIPSGKYIYQLELGEHVENGSLVISH